MRALACAGVFLLFLLHLRRFDGGSSVNARAQYGWTVLMRAAASGKVDCMQVLLEAGADKDATSNVRRRFSLLLSRQ